VETVRLVAKCGEEEPHQHRYFFLRALPVFGGKRVQGEILDTQLTAHLNDVADGFYPFTMTGDTGESPLFCPSTVAVHNNGNMSGNLP
jgi:hypothetical protein